MTEKRKVSIIIDSGCDMLPDEAKALGITLIPLNVRFGNEEFEDGVTLSRDEFFTRLENAKELPKTSLIAPDRYERLYKEAVDAGNDVVCMALSSAISGCYQSAVIAAEEYAGRVFVVDTQQFCAPEYLLAMRAVRFRDEGMDAETIAKKITEECHTPRVIAVFDTLEYLRKGGRIDAAAAVVGGILSIKPIISILDGKVAVLGKARGAKNAIKELNNIVKKLGIDWDKPMMLSWSGTDPSYFEQWIENCDLFEGHDRAALQRSRVGATIGTYTGPNALAISFYPINQE